MYQPRTPVENPYCGRQLSIDDPIESFTLGSNARALP